MTTSANSGDESLLNLKAHSGGPQNKRPMPPIAETWEENGDVNKV